MKIYGVTLLGYGAAGQQRCIVQAPNQKAAAEAFGVTVGFLRNYGGVSANPRELQAAGQHPPLTVLRRPLDDVNAAYEPQ